MSKRIAAVVCMAALCALGGDRDAYAQLVRHGQRVPDQQLHHRQPVRSHRSPSTPMATSWWPGTPHTREAIGLYDIFAARFNSAGALLGGEFQVNTYTTSIQRRPSVAAESNGDFVDRVAEHRAGGRPPRLRRLRPALQLERDAAGRRVPDQRLHDLLDRAEDRFRHRRRLRRGLAGSGRLLAASASSPAASTLPEPRWPPSSGSTPLP